jgi:hypothetical protein
MAAHKQDQKEQLPAQIELYGLKKRAFPWLGKHGFLKLGHRSRTIGQTAEEYIIDGPDLPRHEYTASAEAIEAVVPEAAEELDLNGPLRLTYVLSHRYVQGESFSYEREAFYVSIAKNPFREKGDSDETWLIGREPQRGDYVSALQPIPVSEIDRETEIVPYNGRQLTKRQCQALISIVENLDSIKEVDDVKEVLDIQARNEAIGR